MCDDDLTAIIIDHGSAICRAGFAGDHGPCAVFPSVVGRPRRQQCMSVSKDLNDCYVGDEAQARRDVLSLKYPIEHGVITNWDDMEALWQYTFRKALKSDPKLHPLLITEPAVNPKANRQKMTQIMFETYQTPSMYLAAQPVLNLYASGRTTGVVVDCGDGVSLSVPIYEGFTLRHAVTKIPICGRDLTDHLMRTLGNRGHSFTTVVDREIVRDIKEKLCYVALDFGKEMETAAKSYFSIERNYQLPDGKVISVGKERFETPEAMFEPSITDTADAPGVHTATYYSIRKCDKEVANDFYANIVLAGGSSRFPGFAERMQKEMADLAPLTVKTQVIAPSDHEHPAWVGGSSMASTPSFHLMCVSIQEYDEFGPAVVHRKCF